MKIIAFLRDNRTYIFKYLGVGVCSMGIDVGGLYLLAEMAGFNYLISAAASFWLGLLANFALNKLWTFQKKQGTIKQAMYYLGLVLFNYIFTLGFMYFVTDVLGSHYLFGKIVAIGLMTVWNFFIYKKIIFK